MLKKYAKWLIPAGALLLAAVLLLCTAGLRRQAEAKTALEKSLPGVWTREGDGGWYLALMVDEDSMDLRFVAPEFPQENEVLYHYGYEVKSGQEIYVLYDEGKGKSVRVTMSPDGKELTMTPAVTSSDDQEVWKR